MQHGQGSLMASGSRVTGVRLGDESIVADCVIVTGAQSPEYLANAIQRIAGQHTRLRA